MSIQIRQRSDGQFNVWKEDFFVPVHNLHLWEERASSWQVVAVIESYEEAVKLRKGMKK